MSKNLRAQTNLVSAERRLKKELIKPKEVMADRWVGTASRVRGRTFQREVIG
jgi:hypothetical protein